MSPATASVPIIVFILVGKLRFADDLDGKVYPVIRFGKLAGLFQLEDVVIEPIACYRMSNHLDSDTRSYPRFRAGLSYGQM